jgi:hypothetical protein
MLKCLTKVEEVGFLINCRNETDTITLENFRNSEVNVSHILTESFFFFRIFLIALFVVKDTY